MSIVQGPFRGDQKLFVYTGDTTYYFGHGDRYPWTYLKQVFRERIRLCPSCSHPYELFPGLVLQDEEEKLWRVQLQVALVPVKPEERHESAHTERKSDEVPAVRRDDPPVPQRGGTVRSSDQSPRKR